MYGCTTIIKIKALWLKYGTYDIYLYCVHWFGWCVPDIKGEHRTEQKFDDFGRMAWFLLHVHYMKIGYLCDAFQGLKN